MKMQTQNITGTLLKEVELQTNSMGKKYAIAKLQQDNKILSVLSNNEAVIKALENLKVGGSIQLSGKIHPQKNNQNEYEMDAHMVMDTPHKDPDPNQVLADIQTLQKDNNPRRYYPFKEGSEYYTIENDKIVKSFWDDQSEHLHDLKPNKDYFKTKKDAENFLSVKNLKVNPQTTPHEIA